MFLTEDEVKQGAKEYLEASGFRVTVAWGRQRGIDIRAVSGAEVMLLEAKGSAVNPPQQMNYFLGALGELLQRMPDPAATYGLALPDSRQYRGLAARLPALAWQRLTVELIAARTAVRRGLRHLGVYRLGRAGLADLCPWALLVRQR